MSSADPFTAADEAMVDLLIKQITEGLSPAEERALTGLDGHVATIHSREFERTVAAITLSGTAPRSELPPAALQARLAQQAQAFFADRKVTDFKARATSNRAPNTRGSAGGWFAAAACLLLAVLGWLRSPPQIGQPPAAKAPEAVVEIGAAAVPKPLQLREALLAKAGVLKISLGATKDPMSAGVSGDVVWDPDTQRGFLRFVGLPANDPRISQYQAWIFDAQRDKRFPVDAGVFDVSADASQIIVPIRAALPIGTPKAFAVTMEKPGGVVVSALKHVLLLGAV